MPGIADARVRPRFAGDTGSLFTGITIESGNPPQQGLPAAKVRFSDSIHFVLKREVRLASGKLMQAAADPNCRHKSLLLILPQQRNARHSPPRDPEAGRSPTVLSRRESAGALACETWKQGNSHE
jgi:hypothetical protein